MLYCCCYLKCPLTQTLREIQSHCPGPYAHSNGGEGEKASWWEGRENPQVLPFELVQQVQWLQLPVMGYNILNIYLKQV